MTKMLRTGLLLLTVFIGSFAFSQPPTKEDRKVKREKLHAQKIAFITTELNFSPSEAQVFWPVYNLYEAEIDAIRKTRRGYMNELKKDKNLTPDRAYELFELIFGTEKTESNIRLSYLKKFSEILDKEKAARVFIAEERFKRKLMRELKKGIPPPPPE